MQSSLAIAMHTCVCAYAKCFESVHEAATLELPTGSPKRASFVHYCLYDSWLCSTDSSVKLPPSLLMVKEF